MFLSDLSIKRPILVTMAIVALIIFGGLAYKNMDLNLFPDVSPPYIMVTTIYPGAGPKEVETQITKKIEDAIASVSGIKMMQSFSMENASLVMLEFNIDKDPNIASQEIKDKIDQIINTLPTNAEQPMVEKFNMQEMPVIDFVLSGNINATELYDIADKNLKDRLSRIKGVARVDLIGGREREVQISLDGKMMYENAISLPQMMQIISAANLDMPGGYFQSNDIDYTVRLKGKFTDINQIKEIEIPTAFGNKKMRQITDVQDAAKNVREKAVYYDNTTFKRNENVIRLSMVKSTDGNAVAIGETVQKELDEIRSTLPPGVKLEIINDDSTFTNAALKDTLNNVLLGVLFTSLVLLVFLHDIRSTFIVALSMPTAIIITFLIMQMFGLSKNVLSLMGLSVSVGVLVANSVVVIENIFRHKAMGKDNIAAASQGTSEVVVAVLASTLTNMCVFIPIATMQSMVGMMLAESAIAAVAATAVSILTAFTITPMLASRLLPKGNFKVGAISKIMNKFEDLYTKGYEFLLRGSLKNALVSILVIVFTLILFIVTMSVYGSRLRFGFFPDNDKGRISVTAELPTGYNLEATNSVVREIEKSLKKYPDVEYSIANLGKKDDSNKGVNLASMEIYLTDVSARDKTVWEYIEILSNDFSKIPNAKIGIANVGGFSDGGAPMELNLYGPDLNTLESIKEDLMYEYRKINGLMNLDNSSRSGKTEILVTPNRKKMNDAGIMVQDIAYTLRAAIEGMETATQYEEGGEEYDMLITVKDEQVNTPEKIGQIPIVSQAGVFRLNQICDISFSEGYTSILHLDKAKIINFKAFNAPGVSTGDLMPQIDEVNNNYEFPAGYGIKWGGMAEMQQDMMTDMSFAFILAILLTYMLLAAILESFWQPLIILLTVPLALIGSVIAMYITDTEIGMSAMLGIIMLIGIVVNNAILILDLANQYIRSDNMSTKEGLVKAATTKLKTILMSSIAIILGMLPMAVGMGESMVEMRKPMGVIAIGGLVASTVLALFVIPAFYYLIKSMGDKIKGLFVKN